MTNTSKSVVWNVPIEVSLDMMRKFWPAGTRISPAYYVIHRLSGNTLKLAVSEETVSDYTRAKKDGTPVGTVNTLTLMAFADKRSADFKISTMPQPHREFARPVHRDLLLITINRLREAQGKPPINEVKGMTI